MEKVLTDIPVLQKNKPGKAQEVNDESSCGSQPSDGTSCCTPDKNKEENNGACCAQPGDGSACCNK